VRNALVWAHPALGAAVLALLCFTGWLGLASRGRQSRHAALRVRHARLAPITYVAVAASWLAGWVSARLLRPELGDASALHMQSGTLILALLSASALLARWMARGSPAAREIHPWLGAGALLLAAAQAMTGLRILP
jgi:uncharacterized membrane protein